MHQKALFDEDDQQAAVDTPEDLYAIHSGRVGIIGFGATAASWALTQEALADLAALPLDDVETPG